MKWRDEAGVLHQNCAVFFKVSEEFGGFSNMAGGYPLLVNKVTLRTSEALFQACRFPYHPDIQQEIIDQKSPMAVKMVAKKDGRRDRFTRPDWDAVRVDMMRWCLAVKLAWNYPTFRSLLLSTGDRPIVEKSRKDAFWGGKEVKGEAEMLEGQNVLGQLLMNLRQRVQSDEETALRLVAPLPIPNFRLLGHDIQAVDNRLKK